MSPTLAGAKREDHPMTEPDRAELLERIRSLEADKTWWKRVAVALLCLLLFSFSSCNIRYTDRARAEAERARLAEELVRAQEENERLKKELQAAEPDRAEKRWFRPNR